ncbi:SgcJ/EcaC family oxidoreductase [bacterium]|nr:SgcJ/EcaC family oxidoreductase [bacterium]
MVSRFLVGLGLLWTCAAPTLAQELKPEQARKVIEQSAIRYSAAFAKRDAKALAALFTPEAEYIDADGTIFHGRKVIEAEYAASFAVSPQGEVDIELLSIRPIATGVLVEEGISTFTPTEGESRTASRYVATHVRQPDGTWLIASVREVSSGPVTPHDRLTALSWLMGDWHEDVEGETISTNWTWDASGNFLLSEFQIQSLSGLPLQGNHRIGWDAERKQLRSWIFDTTGGSAEGWWQQNDDATWSLNVTRIDADGVRTVARLTYAADGKDAMVVIHDQIVRAGSTLPGSSHRIVRRPPAPASATR